MIGLKISVEVADAKGNKDVSDETAPVAVYEELEILSADQTGAKTVALTFSDDVDADDKLEVKKGTKAVKIDSTTYGDAAAEITLADKIVDGATYTVTLTPANGDPATSVEFVGEVATLGEIVFLNDVLVMKDSSYSKGFAYVKGYDQYGDEINLSGLTVTPGVGVFESYDPSTGKITIDDGVADGTTSPFMTIKEVPVFVQYQNGTTVLSAQANLTVSSQAYLSEMEFGEIKKDGTARDDGRLTVTELSSKKYYIEILDPKDQYGNALTADDLNTQKNGDDKGNKTLFVIPSDSGAFYLTGNFGTLGGKTILWLENAPDSKPGTMALTITGAGGNTFTTDVTVEDDPYIQSLNVTYPMLYAGVAKSDKLDFTAIDQYGDPVDLWDFKPALAADGKIKFTDKNHMTNRVTEISVSGSAAFNEVDKNAGQKDFTVTLDTRKSKKNDIQSFVVTTAGMDVRTASVTVGGEGKAATIKNSGSTVQLDNRGGSDKYDFNSKIAFEDANGNTMKRDDADYPIYSDVVPLDGMAVPNNFTATNYYWTLVADKVTNANKGTLRQVGTNGEFKYAEIGAPTYAKRDIYAILWASDDAGHDYLVDQELFHFTAVIGNEETYTAKCADTLYVKKSDTYTDNVKVTVTAKTDKGETYSVADNRIRVSGIPFATDGNNVVYGNYDLDEVGSKTASVFVKDFESGTWDEVASVTINYTNVAPVPTKVSYGFKSVNNGSQAASKYGVEVSGTPADTIYDRNGGATITVSGGVMTLKGIDCETKNYGDKVEAKIVDQYGQAITTTTFKANGAELVKGSTIAAGKNVIEYSAGSVVGRFTLVNALDITPTIPTSTTVTTEGSLRSALAGDASTITVNGDIELTKALIIPDGKTVIVASGKTLKDDSKEDDAATNESITLGTGGPTAATDKAGANLVVNGTLITNEDFTMTGFSKVTVNGVWDKTAGDVKGTLTGDAGDTISDEITGTGHVTFDDDEVSDINFTVTGDTLVLNDVTFTGSAKLAGHVIMTGTINTTGQTVELQDKLNLDLSGNPTLSAGFSFAKGATINVTLTDNSVVTLKNSDSSAAAEGVEIDPDNGTVSGGDYDKIGSTANFDDALALWVDLAALDEANANTANALQNAKNALDGFTEAELEEFEAALASAVPGTNLDTVDAITAMVEGLIDAYEDKADAAVASYVSTYTDVSKLEKENAENFTSDEKKLIAAGIAAYANLDSAAKDYSKATEIKDKLVALQEELEKVDLSKAKVYIGETELTASYKKAGAVTFAVKIGSTVITDDVELTLKSGDALSTTESLADNGFTLVAGKKYQISVAAKPAKENAYKGTFSAITFTIGKAVGTIEYTTANIKEGATSVAVTKSDTNATGTFTLTSKDKNKGNASVDPASGALDLTNAKENDEYTITFTGSGEYDGTATANVTVQAKGV